MTKSSAPKAAAMTNSEIFKTAHEMARGTVKAVGDYRIAFSLAIKEIRTFLAEGRTTRAPVDRTNRFTKPKMIPAKFEGGRVEKYIKNNSRIKRELETTSKYGLLINEEYEAGKKSGRFGVAWEEAGKYFAYEYFN